MALQHFPYAIHTAGMLLVTTEVEEVNCNQRMGAPTFLQVTHLNSKFAQSWLILIFFSPINHFLGPSSKRPTWISNMQNPDDWYWYFSKDHIHIFLGPSSSTKWPNWIAGCKLFKDSNRFTLLYEMYVFTTSQLCKSSLNLKIWKVAQIKHEVCGI